MPVGVMAEIVKARGRTKGYTFFFETYQFILDEKGGPDAAPVVIQADHIKTGG